MNNPIDIDEVKNFIAWQFFTSFLVMKDRHDPVELFTGSFAKHLTHIEFDGDDPVYLVRELLHAVDGRTAHALYHLCMGVAKWQPTERDLCFLCGAEELVAGPQKEAA